MMALILVYGCGSKENEPVSTTTTQPIKNNDFVPEHVRNSTIEVVPH